MSKMLYFGVPHLGLIGLTASVTTAPLLLTIAAWDPTTATAVKGRAAGNHRTEGPRVTHFARMHTHVAFIWPAFHL